MKILDLTNPDKSEIKYEISKFPDGQQALTITSIPYLSDMNLKIKSRLRNFLDLELIICANQALKETINGANVSLYVPFFMGARSDRKFLDGQSNYLKTVITPIINSQGFSSVNVFDPHSDVLEACLNNFKKTSNIEYVKSVIGLYDGDITLISPDAGALKKIYDVAKAVDCENIIVANKVRDLKTGKIVRTEVPGINSEVGKKKFVIIDDICDGGRTFIEIAKEIRNIRPKVIFNDEIYLVVSHGIFSAGFDELSKYFNKIWTTNSYNEIDYQNPFLEDDFINQIDIFN